MALNHGSYRAPPHSKTLYFCISSAWAKERASSRGFLTLVGFLEDSGLPLRETDCWISQEESEYVLKKPLCGNLKLDQKPVGEGTNSKQQHRTKVAFTTLFYGDKIMNPIQAVYNWKATGQLMS